MTWLMAMAAPAVLAVKAGTSPAAHVTRFDLISHGMTVGHGRIIRESTLRNNESCLTSRLVIESKVSLPFYKYALQMDEVWITDTNGLIAYKSDRIENGRRQTITGELHNRVFNFEITEAGQKRVWSTPRTAFELAANSHPARALADGEVIKVCVLDPSTCAVTERIYRGTGPELLTVGRRQIMCHTFTIEYPGARIRRWFITDEFGPLILREDGREARGAYSRRAVSMDLEQKAAE